MDRENIERAADLMTRAHVMRDAARAAAERGDHALAHDLRWMADEADEMADDARFHLSPADSRAAVAVANARMARRRGVDRWCPVSIG